MANIKFDLQHTIKAIHAKGGFVSQVADSLGVNRYTVCRWRKKYKAVDEAFTDVEESKLDFAESKLMEAIKQGEAYAICFFLKCKGKQRGYVERQEVTGPNGGAIEVARLDRVLSVVQSAIVESLEQYPEAKEALINALRERRKEMNGNGNDDSD